MVAVVDRVSLASFATYVLTSPSHEMTADLIFVSLTYFNQIRMPMSMLPFLIVQFVQVGVGVRNLRPPQLVRGFPRFFRFILKPISTWVVDRLYVCVSVSVCLFKVWFSAAR